MNSPTKQHSFVTPASSFLYVAAATAAVLCYAFLYVRWHRKSALPPGPVGLPIVGSLPFLDPQLHTYFARLAKTYGPICRIKLGNMMFVIVSSSSVAREVVRDHDYVMANRKLMATASIITYGGSTILWSSNGPTWRMLRRICVQEMLSRASLDAVYDLRRSEVRATVHKFRARAAAGEAVNVGEEMLLTVSDVIMSTLWGASVVGGERSRVGKEFREMVCAVIHLMGKPNVSDFIPFLARFDLQGLQGKMKLLLDRFDEIFTHIIDEKKKKKKMMTEVLMNKEVAGRMDFLDYLLKLEQEGSYNNTPFTLTNVKAILVDMIIAGSHATASTMEWVMAVTMKNPKIMARIQQELDQVVGKDNIVEESHIPGLPYLAAVIKETLRLYPVSPLLTPRCPASACTVGGYTVPPGSMVFLNVWAIQRDPSVWEDPLEFKPERFLNSAANFDFSGSDTGFIPFGSGRRGCAGIPLAETMVTHVLASLLHSFDWKVPEGTEIDLASTFGVVLNLVKPLVAIPTPRLPNPDQYA
ncbi:putative cytochrome P450 76M5-like [Iris pallida]|uniref:Cytochrome P450 76M5-like n=1 Tax=Iris pallida TaxID=29817 RepID=A0AAX6EY72_IRIPA|nr:putative cytochrome P450 76M5-like [Iris pallida]KAJ6831870.1 putative cytochrome P450 76M5-like [Iris pallida]